MNYIIASICCIIALIISIIGLLENDLLSIKRKKPFIILAIIIIFEIIVDTIAFTIDGKGTNYIWLYKF